MRRWLAVLGLFSGLTAAATARAEEAPPGPADAAADAATSEGAASEAATETPRPLGESLTGDAKADYEAARLLYEDGDYAGALTKLEAAYRQSSDPRLLWNMAAAEKNLRHYAKVLGLLDRYLKADPKLVTAEDRNQALALLDVARGFVASVSVTVVPAGASVEIDGVEVGKAPLAEPAQVDFGQRTLRVSKPGYVTKTETLLLEGGKGKVVSVRLEEEVHEGDLRVVTDPKTSIRLDGKVVGVGMWSGKLASGSHTIQLEEPGKLPETTEIALKDREERTLNVHLRVAPSDRRGSVPAWIWVSGGVAAAALGTGAYFLLQKDGSAPSPLEGTWGTLEL
jgi:tetratricopeptide (TPR) repeat protein